MFTTHTKTAERIYELLTENTGTHFLDSGMSEGRHWQQNQKHTIEEWLARPNAILETEYGTYPTLDLFHFLNDRLTLTEKARNLQNDFMEWIEADLERSPYSIQDMEEWANQWHDNRTDYGNAQISNSYNWENYLSQTIQYLNFEHEGQSFVLLQVHGGADVRGGYTHPQVFEATNSYWAHDMTGATIQCTVKDCDFYLDIRGIYDVCNADGDLAMTSSEFGELKLCPDCGGTLEAIAPEPTDW
jgi:hypothetical protein